MARWGRRWTHVPGESGPVPGMRRVGGRYVARQQGRPRGPQGEAMRSRWEVNYAYFLRFLGIPYEYEARVFWFEQIKTGTRRFCPDFYLPRTQEFHEVKGYMTRRSRTQLKRMKKYHPQVKLVLIDAAFFASVERQHLCRVIPGWACRHNRSMAAEERS